MTEAQTTPERTNFTDDTWAHLLEYLKELEQNVERHSEELGSSERRYRELFEAEQRRSRDLATLMEIGKIALGYEDVDEYLAAAAEAIQKNFSYYDVTLFLIDEDTGELVLRSHAGGYRGFLPLGYRQKVGEGIIGWVAASGEPLVVNDVTQEPRFVKAFPGECLTQAELAIPIKVGNSIQGVIDVQSRTTGAFHSRDVAVLQSAADMIAAAVDHARLSQETLLLKELSEAVVESMPLTIIVIDAQRRVVLVNRSFCEQAGVSEEEVKARPIEEVMDPGLLNAAGLLQTIQHALAMNETLEVGDVTYTGTDGEERTVEIRIASLSDAEHRRALVAIRDVTQQSRRMARMALLQNMGNLLQRTLDLDHVLFTLLTCITAGPALAFNRGFVLLLDRKKEVLDGVMALGPGSAEEAHHIWREIGQRRQTLEELVEAFDREQINQTEIQQLVRSIHIPLHLSPEMIVARVVRERTSYKVGTDAVGAGLCCPYCGLLHAQEFAVAPLVARDEVLGVVLADNAFNAQPIGEEDLQLLTMLCNQAGLAIANAQAHERIERHIAELAKAYRQLKTTQDDLVRSEKLAAVGEMAARVSHEIRNPLATVGGFARSLLKNPEDVQRVKHDASIIVQEVDKLEDLLRTTLDLIRPSRPVYRLESVNVVVEHACVLLREEMESSGVYLVKDIDRELPEIPIAASQIQQAVLNLLKNAIQAMPEGGTLTVETGRDGDAIVIRAEDTGSGIPSENLHQVFAPFYTTKVQGSGLGLAVTKKIAEDHGGSITVESEVGRGSVFTLRLPVEQTAQSNWSADAHAPTSE